MIAKSTFCCRLICAPENRLGKDIQEIKSHPWFKGFDWDNIREMEPPFIPQLEDELDTSYFTNLDEAEAEGELNGGDHETIDDLLHIADKPEETNVSSVWSHMDNKKHRDKEKKDKDGEKLNASSSEGEHPKLKFNASYSRFDFAGFTYKHEDIPNINLTDLTKPPLTLTLPHPDDAAQRLASSPVTLSISPRDESISSQTLPPPSGRLRSPSISSSTPSSGRLTVRERSYSDVGSHNVRFSFCISNSHTIKLTRTIFPFE